MGKKKKHHRRHLGLQHARMHLWFALASLTSVAALHAGVRVQPRVPTTKIGRVVPARCVLAEAEEPGLKQFAIDAGITTLRLGTCALMIHHGFDKVQNVDGFSANVVAKFFGFLPGNPAFWTLSAAATQIAGAGLLSVGLLARPVALSMMFTMLAAVVFHLLNTGAEGFPLAVVSQHSYNYELAAMYVCVLAYFSAAGAGAYSIDEQVLGGELRLYDSLFNKVFGGKAEE